MQKKSSVGTKYQTAGKKEKIIANKKNRGKEG
jgi:hypothetical protein